MSGYRAKSPIGQTNGGSRFASGLLMAYHLNEGAGLTTRDPFGGNSGTFVNTGATSTSGWVSGRYGHEFAFDGTNDRCDLTTNARILAAPTNDFTIAALVRWTTTSTGMGAFTLGRTTSLNPFVIIGNGATTGTRGRFSWRNDASSGSDIQGGTAFNDGEPHLIVGVKLGTATTLYVDGKVDGTGTGASGAITLDNAEIGCLRRTSIAAFWNGGVLGAWMWNYPMTAGMVWAMTADPFHMFRRRSVPVPLKAASGAGASGNNLLGEGTLVGAGRLMGEGVLVC